MASADTFVNYGISRGKLIRAGPIVWHSQLPACVSSLSNAATLTSLLQNHITMLVSRYKGKMYSWDVVKDALEDNG